MTSFGIRYTGLNTLLTYLGLGPARSGIDVDGNVRIRMGWGFSVRFLRTEVESVALDTQRVLGWGVHGWRGVWLVNGSSTGMVRIDLRDPVRGRVMGFPVRVRAIRVSVDAPVDLVAALSPGSDADG